MKKIDQDLLIKHLEATASPKGDKSCPCCGHTEWQAEGPYYMTQLEGKIQANMIMPSTFTCMPLAVLCCSKCWHVELFAWEPIIKAAREQ